MAAVASSGAAGSVASGVGEGSAGSVEVEADSAEVGADSGELESVGVAWEPESTEASDGAWEVGEPVAGSSPPQAVANITIMKPMTPALSQEGL
ncbi:MAG: hypothetical protein OXM62_01900 [bacterium]|nr:hypothetical protein [bacterium]MDE0233741.1 hypothetical protein [bacterium]